MQFSNDAMNFVVSFENTTAHLILMKNKQASQGVFLKKVFSLSFLRCKHIAKNESNVLRRKFVTLLSFYFLQTRIFRLMVKNTVFFSALISMQEFLSVYTVVYTFLRILGLRTCFQRVLLVDIWISHWTTVYCQTSRCNEWKSCPKVYPFCAPKPIKMQSSGTFLLVGQKVFVKQKENRKEDKIKKVRAILLNVAH